MLGLSTPASAKWRMAESEHFVIYAEDSAKDLQKFAQMLENYHAAMAIVSGRTVDKAKVAATVVAREAKLRAVFLTQSQSVTSSRTIPWPCPSRH